MNIKNQNHLYTFNRFKTRVYPRNLPVHIFGSSSRGNSVYLERLRTLIDLGFPYKRYAELDQNFFIDVDYVLLTHEHPDHINIATFHRILEMHPNVKFVISPAMARDMMAPHFIEKRHLTFAHDLCTKYAGRFISAQQPLVLRTRDGLNFLYTPHVTEHGTITNVAIELTANQLGLHALYASDLDTIYGNPAKHIDGLPFDHQNPFSLIFLEANYDEALLQEALRADPHDAKALGNLRHMSEQTAWAYVTQFLADDGLFVPLHASSMYGTLVQDTE